MSSLIEELFLKSNLLVFIINILLLKKIYAVYKHMRLNSEINLEILIFVEIVSYNFTTMFHTITILVFLVNIIPNMEIKSYLFYGKYFLIITGWGHFWFFHGISKKGDGCKKKVSDYLTLHFDMFYISVTMESSVMSITHILKGVWDDPLSAVDLYSFFFTCVDKSYIWVGDLYHFDVIWCLEFHFPNGGGCNQSVNRIWM